MAEPEYPVLRELETKLKLRWVDTDDVMATQRAIIQVEPEAAYLELPRGRKGDKGDPGPAISIQGIVAADSQLPAGAEVGHAYVNTSTKGLAVWNGAQWFKVDNFAGVDADVQQFSRWFAQIESDTRRALDAAERAEFAAEETIQQVEGDFATRNYVDAQDQALGERIDDAHWWKGSVGSQHLDTLISSGRYSQFQTSASTLEKGYPVPFRGLIDVARQSTANASQTYTTTSAIVPPQVFLRSTTNAHEPAPVWTEWTPFFTSQSDEESAAYIGSIGRSVRESEMRRKTGRVTTGGKAAIALIFDHGTDKFRDIVLPALQARGLAGTLALNADRLEPTYVHKWSESVPWDTVAQWAANGIEIANHSLDHLGADTPEETYRQIVYGRELLESYVGQDIYSWVHHGTQTRGDYDGFGTANRDYLWADKLAGQLILSSHVATTGNIVQKDYTFPLDGTVPIGGRGVWIDQKQQMADAYGMLDKVIELGGRMMFRCHPMYIDHQDQFLTTQEFLDFLDYVKEKVDEGLVVSLTMREWSIAERGEEDKADEGHRHVPAEIDGLHHYSGTGFPNGVVSAPVGATYTDTAATNGAVRWVKTSGTGNTGWQVEYGDTGWRDITAQYSTDAGESGPLELGAGAKILIRRTSGDVYFRLTGPITARSAFGSIVQLLTGWRPEVDTEVALPGGVGIRHTRYWISLERATSGAAIAVSGRSVLGQWPTTEPWPTSLPGTPL